MLRTPVMVHFDQDDDEDRNWKGYYYMLDVVFIKKT